MAQQTAHISLYQIYKAVYLWAPEQAAGFRPIPLETLAVKKHTRSLHPKRQRIATLIQDILTARLWQHLTLLPLALALLNQQQFRDLGLLVLVVQLLLLLVETVLIIISNLLLR